MPNLHGSIGSTPLSGRMNGAQSVGARLNASSTNMSNDHNMALNRDLPNQHPISAITGLEYALLNRFDDAWVDEGYLILKRGDEQIRLGPFAGGGSGGGGQNNAVLTLQNTTGWIYKSIAQNTACILSATWSSIEDELPTGGGIVTLRVGGSMKFTGAVSQGSISIDVSPYLTSGTNNIKLQVTDIYDNSRSINYTINVVALTISSSFDATAVYSGNITFPYVPVGAVEKTVHFILDGTEVGTETITESGRQQTRIISGLTHGSHTWTVYFEATIDGEDVTSNVLYYDIIYAEAGNTTPIIASTFRTTTAEQYIPISIPYIVYDPANLTADIVLAANGATVQEINVDRTTQTWSYRPDNYGNLALTIRCGATTKIFTITVQETSMNVEAVTRDLSLYLSAYGRSNGEEHPEVWGYGGIAAQLSGFGFVSDGWLSDSDGNTMLRLKGNASVTIPLHIFAEDFRDTGKTIEVEFETSDVMDYDANIISCWSGDRGILITPQSATFASEQSSIGTQYKENEHVRMTFVVEKRSENRLIYIYLNGVMCGVTQYPATDDFSQLTPVNITIGSPYCTTDIYCIRVYDNSLTRIQVLNNWIADTQNGVLKRERYNRNNVYDDYGSVVVDKLPSDLPVMTWTIPVLPQYKGDKRNAEEIVFDNPNAALSFIAYTVQMNVQGTSSQYYFRKNFKISFKNGLVINGTESNKYAFRTGAIPEKEFTLKADVASSEGANNVELVRLYNDAARDYGVLTPPQEDDSRVRVGIDGIPMVCFHDDGIQPYFYGKFNFNNDKGTETTYGFQDGDESWEIKNNTDNPALFKEWSDATWSNVFEARYPEDNTDVTRLKAMVQWIASTNREAATGNVLAESYTDSSGTVHTTDNAAYRLAKFRTELTDHFNLQSSLFYYLFTELFLMIDSRAKNAFPSYFAETGRWYWLPYDFDTAIGINNEGKLVFGYALEDTDYIDPNDPEATVYNGQTSVFWCNLRDSFQSELQAMYSALRSRSYLNYDYVENAFEEHQSKWPEAIFNEDSYSKYLAPLIQENDGQYLGMLLGSKSEQRKWWLYNRFRYMDSKYNAGDARNDYITLRGYSKDSITVTPYADIYASVLYGSHLVQTRALRGSSYTLVNPMDNVNDTEIEIFSASQLASIGDISGLKVGYCGIAPATKLQELKIGDASEEYTNPNMRALYTGNNTLLRKIDCRNCINLGTTAAGQDATTSPSLEGCKNIEEVYFDNTQILGLSLPNGGVLRKLHLPATITNLAILNQPNITEFVLTGHSNITTLRIENPSAVVDASVLTILADMPANSRVRVTGVDWSMNDTSLLDHLLTMRGLSETDGNLPNAVVQGFFHLNGTMDISDWLIYTDAFPYLEITADAYNNDVLVDASYAPLIDSSGKVIADASNGYESSFTGEAIDSFVTCVLAGNYGSVNGGTIPAAIKAEYDAIKGSA